MSVLQRLVDQGNTVIVIEHQMDVIKNADWLIDLGPEGGERGGELLAEGPPERVAAIDASATGRYLRATLARHGVMPEGAAPPSDNGAKPRAPSRKRKGAPKAAARA